MIRRLRLRLLALALPLALLAPVAAHAERVVVEDAAGDVRFIDLAADQDGPRVPHHVTSDITRTVLEHDTSGLEITAHFRDLQNGPLLRMDVRVRTSQGAYYMTLTRIAGKRIRLTFVRRSGREVECARLAGRFDRAGDTVAMSIPAECLGSPRWVQVGVMATDLSLEALEDPEAKLVIYVDDAQRDTLRKRGISLGPQVHRG
jgi:hypothetical protein